MRPSARKGQFMKFTRSSLIIGLPLIVLIFSIMVIVVYSGRSAQEIKIGFNLKEPGVTPMQKDARPDALKIIFTASAAPLQKINKPVTEGIKLLPETKGQWRWETDSMLVFTPSEDWNIGQRYSISMEKSMFPEQVKLKDYDASFSTRNFSARLGEVQFYQDPVNPKLKKVVATVRFSHPVDTERFEKNISFRLHDHLEKVDKKSGREYPFTVSYDEFKGEAYLHTEPLAIPEKDALMVLRIDEGVRSSRGGSPTKDELSSSVTIPGMYNYFRVSSSDVTLVRNEKNEPEQAMVVEFTDSVDEKLVRQNLSAFLLPADKPAMQGQRMRKNYGWYSTSEIGTEVLAEATPVELEPVPSAKESSNLHSFKLNVPPGKYLYLKIEKGIKSAGEYILADVFDNILRVPEYPRELEIMSNGAILSLSGEKKLSMVGRNLEAVKIELGRVLPRQVNHLISQSRGSFSSPYFSGHNFNENNITEKYEEVLPLQKLPPGKSQYFSFDFTSHIPSTLGQNQTMGLYFLKVRGWDPAHKRFLGVDDSRLILLTDLGMIVKDNAEGTHEVYVMSIANGTPVSDAKVEVLGLNGLTVVSSSTDSQGHATLPYLRNFKDEKKPVAYIVRKGQDISFLPFDRDDRNLNFSRFDIGGLHTQGKGDQLNAFLFSDRGIYRPGDTFHIGLIVKSNDWQRNLEGIPLEAIITDARGLEIRSIKFRLKPEGFEELEYQTAENSPTGNYTVSVFIVKDGRRHSHLGSTTVRVEEFLPDRMKISSRFSINRQDGWVSHEGLKAHVSLQNLYGTPATERRVSGEIELRPSYPSFRKYQEFTFFDPGKAEHSYSERLKDKTTDEKGEAVFELGLEKFEKATYRLTFFAEGYEAQGGRAVLTQSSVLVSPLPYLIGFKSDGKLHSINKNSERYVDFIAVDPELNLIKVPGLTLKLLSQQYVSVLKKQQNGTYKYQSELREETIKAEPLSIESGGLRYNMPTDQAGRFVLAVLDSSGTELNRVQFSIAGSENITRSLERNAELEMRLNKEDFTAGEEIEIHIVAPYTGAGLITIEKDKVYAHKWFRTSTNSSVQKIRVPAGLEGNGYVNVSFIRSLDSNEIFMSPLSYGVAPFTVSLDRRDLGITVDVSDLARPGEPLQIKYKAKRPGRAVVFAIDEGILQVARYATPNPLAHFFKKNALEVTTLQIMDLILPEFSRLEALSAPGGGYDEEALGKNLNPFKRKRQKPVVFWSGIVDVDTSERAVTYNVPDYFNGKLRVMAVAVSPDSVGSTQASTYVKGHFVLSPNVPTFVAPEDEFIVSVNVANNVEGSGPNASLSLKLETSEHLEVLDDSTRTMTVDEGREKSETFKIKARDVLGSGNFTFTASMGSKKSKMSVDLSVRPPVPYMTLVNSGYLRDDAITIKVDRDMYPHFRVLEASASPLPLGLSKGLVDYLSKYPYGCTEQLVSQAFPAIVLRNQPEFGYSPDTVEQNLSRAMSILRARQNAEGAFGFWAANSHVSDFQAVYAVHFLTEAVQSGYPVNSGMFDRALSYMKSMAAIEGDTMAQVRISAYAIYLLTRNGIITTNYLSTLQSHVDKYFKDKWDHDLAGVYMAASYKMLKLDSKAEDIIKKYRPGMVTVYDYDNYYDGLVFDSQLLYILSRHFTERLEDLKAEDILKIVEPITKGKFNTTSSSYAILALGAYADAVGKPNDMTLSILEILADDSKLGLAIPPGLFPTVKFSEKAKAIAIEGKGEHFLFYQTVEAGFDRNLPEQEMREGLEVYREYLDTDGRTAERTTLGSELEVHLKIRGIARNRMTNIAVVDLLPGGFEVVLDPAARSGGQSSFKPDYVDMREDRVVVFGTADQNALEFVYRIRATNRGAFKIPPAYGEAMYDPAVKARSVGGIITVEGN